MKVKDALVKSDFKSASAAVSDFKTAINKEASFTHKNDLLSAVEKMNKANSLEKQREAFADVSIIMWKTIKASGKNTQELYYQYCSMKKAYWISKEKEIKNPYYDFKYCTAVYVTVKHFLDKKIYRNTFFFSFGGVTLAEYLKQSNDD